MTFEIRSLIRTRPKVAAKRVIAIIVHNRGNLAACAEEAGTDRRTFARWVEALDPEFGIRKLIEIARADAKKNGAGLVKIPSTRGRPRYRPDG